MNNSQQYCVASCDFWFQVNDKLKDVVSKSTQVAISSSLALRAFPSVAIAFQELVTELHLLYSHKMQFVHQYGLGLHTDPGHFFLIRQGLRPKALSSIEDSLDAKKNLCAVVELDDAVTADLYPPLDIFSQAEGVCRVLVSYQPSRIKELAQNLTATDILILKWNQEVAIMVLGARFQNLKHLTTPFMNWNSITSIEPILTSENKKNVSEFMAQLPSGWKGLKLSDHRVYDRAIIFNEQIDAKAIVDNLPENFQGLEVLNHSNIKGDKFLNQFINSGYSAECLRGLLVVSLSCLEDLHGFCEALSVATNQVLKSSKFSVK